MQIQNNGSQMYSRNNQCKQSDSSPAFGIKINSDLISKLKRLGEKFGNLDETTAIIDRISRMGDDTFELGVETSTITGSNRARGYLMHFNITSPGHVSTVLTKDVTFRPHDKCLNKHFLELPMDEIERLMPKEEK